MTLSSGAKLGPTKYARRLARANALGVFGRRYVTSPEGGLKIVPSELATNKDRFEQEATSAAVLNHPNITQIFETGNIRARISSGPKMGPRWGPYVLYVASRSDTLTTARRVNTGSYRLVRLGDGASNVLKIR